MVWMNEILGLYISLIWLFVLAKKTKSRSAVNDEVACNGARMVRTKVSAPVGQTQSSDDIDYVYDIYYMNSAKFDYRMLENVLTVELMR